MRKIIFFLITVFMFAGLFGQEIKMDENVVQEIEKLKSTLKSLGVEYEFDAFIPESDERKIEDALTVDEFIEHLESMSNSSTTYIKVVGLFPIFEMVWIPGRGFVYIWNGDVSCYPDIVGDDWDGVMHTRETAYGGIVSIKYVTKPNCAYLWKNVHPGTRLCAKLFNYELVYVTGFGYIPTPVPFGNKECGTVIDW
ncbi:MAG: hypothetical protein ACOX2F_08615 [bacterium]